MRFRGQGLLVSGGAWNRSFWGAGNNSFRGGGRRFLDKFCRQCKYFAPGAEPAANNLGCSRLRPRLQLHSRLQSVHVRIAPASILAIVSPLGTKKAAVMKKLRLPKAIPAQFWGAEDEEPKAGTKINA